VLAGLEAGACGLIRRAEATTARLVDAVKSAANGDGTLSPDLLGGLLARIGNLQTEVLRPLGLSFNGLNDREIEVLRLVADGMDTDEIARSLNYSPRTVKNVLHDVTVRFNLRNRSHAVAFALRRGLI
jgi:DNA-binding NarL/FixJ family response regulator